MCYLDINNFRKLNNYHESCSPVASGQDVSGILYTICLAHKFFSAIPKVCRMGILNFELTEMHRTGLFKWCNIICVAS